MNFDAKSTYLKLTWLTIEKSISCQPIGLVTSKVIHVEI